MIFQLPIPKSPELFENIICDLLNSLYNTTSFSLYGRKGQFQNGIDIISYEKRIVARCKLRKLNLDKRKDKIEFINDVLIDIKNILCLGEKIEKIIIATSIENDTLIQDELNSITMLNGITITIEFWSWDYISNTLFLFNNFINKYYSFRNNNIELAKIEVLNKMVYRKSWDNERLYYFNNLKNTNQLPIFDVSFINNTDNTILLDSIDVFCNLLSVAKGGSYEKPLGILKVTKKYKIALKVEHDLGKAGKKTINLKNPLFVYPKSPFRIQIQCTKPIILYLKVTLGFNFNKTTILTPELFFNSDHAISGKIVNYIETRRE